MCDGVIVVVIGVVFFRC